MTSNTRVVVIGAGRAGARPARWPGEFGAPVPPGSPRRASEVTARPTCGGPAGAQVPGSVRAGRADGTAIAYGMSDHVQPGGVLRTGVPSERGRPLLHLLPNDGGS
ncbi:hypothetical protein [Streptomyces sp. NPDC001833]|uniref:hypothetical protein n=1 Tax=Streptomyces sp. NPDC001833 TaxID=3154658 RepID=UPI003323A5FA